MSKRYISKIPKGDFKEIPDHKEYFIDRTGVVIHKITKGNNRGKISIMKHVLKRSTVYVTVHGVAVTVDSLVYKTFVKYNPKRKKHFFKHKDNNIYNHDPDNLIPVTQNLVAHRKEPYKNQYKIIDDKGNIYNSMKDAAKHLYCSHTTIQNYLKDDYKGWIDLKIKRLKEDE